MHPHNGRGSRGDSPAKRRLLPEQDAASHNLVLKWRDEWRTGKSQVSLPPADTKAAASIPGEDQRKHRAKFAQAIARLEFGRSYWDERLQREVKKTRTGSSKQVRKR